MTSGDIMIGQQLAFSVLCPPIWVVMRLITKRMTPQSISPAFTLLLSAATIRQGILSTGCQGSKLCRNILGAINNATGTQRYYIRDNFGTKQKSQSNKLQWDWRSSRVYANAFWDIHSLTLFDSRHCDVHRTAAKVKERNAEVAKKTKQCCDPETMTSHVHHQPP